MSEGETGCDCFYRKTLDDEQSMHILLQQKNAQFIDPQFSTIFSMLPLAFFHLSELIDNPLNDN